MKNLHYFKKIAAILLTVMMVIPTFALPTFAAGAAMTIEGVEYKEVKNDAGTVTSKTEVVGYQIVSKDTANNEWKPSADYFDLYKEVKNESTGEDEEVAVDNANYKEATIWKVKGTSITYPIPAPDNTASPSGEALEALAKIAQGKQKTIDFTYANGKFTNTDDTKGSFLVLVKNNTSTETYNPMLVSRDDSGNPAGVTAAVGNGTAYAKKSDVPFEKVVDRRAPHNGGTNADNDHVTGDAIDSNPTNDDISAVNADPADGVDGNRGDTAGSTGGSVSLDATSGKVTYDASTATFDDVWFRINTKVPDYAENYFDPTFTTRPQFIVYDTLSKGLTFNDVEGAGSNLGLSVKVGNDTIYKSNSDITITKKPTSGTYSGKTFVIEFTEAGLKKYGGKAVEICYSAKLNDKHGVNFDGETNTASLEYTRNPGEAPQKGDDKTTYHYTFTINGKVDGNAKEENREVIKIGLDNNNNPVLQETFAKSEKGWTPLKGVKFELYKASDNSKVKDVITDEDGILRGMDQLDAGEYYLKETEIPAEYSQYKLKDTKIPVVIDAVLDGAGRLESYTVKVNNILVGNYKKIYSANGTSDKVQFLNEQNSVVAEMDAQGNITNTDKANNIARHEFQTGPDGNKTTWKDTDTEAADIINSQAGTLPSTGGMGTVLFTVGGIAIMALALFLLFGGKKKEEQK